MRGYMPWVKHLMIVVVIFVVVAIAVDFADTLTHNCKPTGEQRFVNSFDGVVVEDKLVCDGGSIKWSRN